MKLTHKFKPRGMAKELFADRSDEVLMSGPAGTGKSRACLEKLHMCMLLNPGARGLIVRKTAVSLTSTALVTFTKQVIPEAVMSGDVKWYGGSAKEPAQFKYSNGSSVAVGGMDKPTKIMSSEYDMIYVQEAVELNEEDWEACTTRLRNGVISFQQLIADCNPDVPTHWLKLRGDTGTTRFLESRHKDNPVYYREDGTLTDKGRAYMHKLDNLTGVRRHRLRDGLWVAAEGVIYDEYDPAVHLVDRFSIPQSWERYWTIDFGFNHPFILQRWAEDPDGNLYLYAEIFHTRRTVDQHAANVMAQVKRDGCWIEPPPAAIICDHDAEDRATFQKFSGLPTKAANKKVKAGIEAVQRRFRIGENGKPRIFILRDACTERDPFLVDMKRPTCTVEELPGYVWKGLDKDEPVKELDDGMDAMRYMVAERDLRGEARVRWVA